MAEEQLKGWEKAVAARKQKANEKKLTAIKQAERPVENKVIAEIDLGFTPDPKRTYVFELLEKSNNINYKNLGSEAKAFDPDSKRYTWLRYFPGVDTIFKEDQHESWDEQFQPPLMFSRNQIEAVGEDLRLMEYLMLHPGRENSPYALATLKPFFRLVDKDIDEEIKAKKYKTELSALRAIDETSFEDLAPVARIVFGITDTNETQVRNKLIEKVRAPKNPRQLLSPAEEIIENVGNPKLLRQYYIQLGFDNGIIVADFSSMTVRYVKGSVAIFTLKGKAYVTETTEYTFSPEGNAFYNELRRQILN